MRRALRLLIGICLGSLLLSLPVHFWVSDRQAALRFLYPLSAAMAAPTLDCSPGSFKWLAVASKFSLWRNASPAGQLVYISPENTIHECHYGWAGTPMLTATITAETRFRYASMTKLLTADRILREVQAGRLALSDSVMELLAMSSLGADGRLNEITVEQLLRHSAGFDRLLSVDPMVVHNKKPWCPYDVTPLMDSRLDFEPGERHAYHNLNYCLLGVLLEKNTGLGFRSLLDIEYDLAGQNIKFIDGPYLKDEVNYDFRYSDFYGRKYWKYFDFFALSSSMGLSGSAKSLATLLASLKVGEEYVLTQAPVDSACDESVKERCYGYALYRYKARGQSLLVHVQPGFLYGAPSLAILDEYGGVTVWVGSGARYEGGSADVMLDHVYAALSEHYAAFQL